MKKFIEENLFICVCFLVLTLLVILIYIPVVKLNFLLIDDGQIVQNSRNLIRYLTSGNLSGISNILLEGSEGRVRPAYWLVQMLVSQISFYVPGLMHIFRILVLLTSLILFVKVGLKLKIDIRWIFFALFLFSFNFQNFENFYRLGPTEIYLGLYFLIITNILLKAQKNKFDYFISFTATLLGCMTKETFFLTSFPLIYLLFNNNLKNFNLEKKFIYFTLIINGIFSFIVFSIRNSYGANLGYSQNYKFEFNSIVDNGINYFNQINHYQSPVLLLLFVGAIVWIYNNYKKVFSVDNKHSLMFAFFVLQAIINIAILLPWQFVLGRYLIIVNISIAFAVVIFIEQLWSILPKLIDFKYLNLNLAKNIFLLGLMPFIFIRNLFPIANFQEWQKTDSDLTTDLLKSLSRNIEPNRPVYVNYIKGDANIEIFLETKWHLEEFYNRGDIKFIYLDENNLCIKNESRYILDRSSDRFIQKNNINLNNLELIDSGRYSYDPINYGEVLKSFNYLERSSNWGQSYPFEWNLYRQKPNTCINNKEIKK